MSDFGYNPTVNLNKRTEQEKQSNIIGKVNLGDHNVPIQNQPKDLTIIPVDILR